MKNAKLLSKAEMKNVKGGKVDGHMCDSWADNSYDVCFNCCITVHSQESCADQYC